MPPPEGKHDVSRARPAAYNNGSPRAPVSLLARGGISPPARFLASRCLGSPSWQHHFAAESICLYDALSHHPSEKQMDVGMIVGKKRVQRASIAPQMARAVFIPPTYPDQISRPGIPARGPPAIAPRQPRRRVSPSVRPSAYQPGYTRLHANKNGSLDGSRDEGTLARTQPWLAGSSWAENSRMKASARSTILVDPTK